eukprot:11106600-Heterocapsa_arctica.AAC.1
MKPRFVEVTRSSAEMCCHIVDDSRAAKPSTATALRGSSKQRLGRGRQPASPRVGTHGLARPPRLRLMGE